MKSIQRNTMMFALPMPDTLMATDAAKDELSGHTTHPLRLCATRALS